MHQQVRSMTIKNTSNDAARSEEGSLVDVLSILQGMNLRSAGGTNLDSGGPFIFSVHHREGDDTADRRARDLLKKNDYEAEVYEVDHCVLDDREGALLECIRKTETERGEPVVELHVLTAEEDGRIPVQLITPSMIARGGETAR